MAILVLPVVSATGQSAPARSLVRTYQPQWTRTIGTKVFIRDVVAMADGGFAALIESGDFGDRDTVLRSFDATGTQRSSVLLDQNVCSDGKLETRTLVHVPGVGFTVLGAVKRGIGIDFRPVHDVWVARYYDDGVLAWQKLIGAPHGDENGDGSIAVAPDGRVAVAYQQMANDSMLAEAPSFVTELSSQGLPHWTTRLTDIDTTSSDLVYRADGQLLLAAGTRSQFRDSPLHLLSFALSGVLRPSQPVVRVRDWYSVRITSDDGATVIATLHGQKRTHRVTFPDDAAPTVASTRSLDSSDQEMVIDGATLHLPSAMNGSEPRELRQVIEGKLVRHPLMLPDEVSNAACPAPGPCRRDIRVKLGAVLTDGTIVVTVHVEAKNDPRPPDADINDYRSYDFLVALRPEPPPQALAP